MDSHKPCGIGGARDHVVANLAGTAMFLLNFACSAAIKIEYAIALPSRRRLISLSQRNTHMISRWCLWLLVGAMVGSLVAPGVSADT